MRKILPIFLLFALLLSGCDQRLDTAPTPSPTPTVTPTPTPAAPDYLGLPWEPKGGWNPYAGDTGPNTALLPLLAQPLYELDRGFRPSPVLVSAAQQSGDGLTWTFVLRAGLTLSDGSVLTAERVAQAVDQARGKDSLYFSRLSGIKKVSFEGETTLIFQLYEKNANFVSLLDFPIFVVDGDGILGTGPYKLEGEWLTAWGDGQTELPAQKLRLIAVTGAEDTVEALDSGRLGLVSADLTGPDALGYSNHSQGWDYPTSTMLYLAYNCEKGACRAPELRQILGRCLDRGAMVTDALSGHGAPATLPTPPTSSRYDADLADTLNFDLTAAGEGLEELGYTLNEEGLRVKGKTPLKLKLLTATDSAPQTAAARILEKDLAGLGITLEVESLPFEDYLAALKKGDFDCYLASTRLTADGDLTAFFTEKSDLSYGAAWNKAMKDALKTAKATGNWPDFYKIWLEAPTFSPIAFKTGTLLTRWGVGGANPTQGNLFYDLENWTIS